MSTVVILYKKNSTQFYLLRTVFSYFGEKKYNLMIILKQFAKNRIRTIHIKMNFILNKNIKWYIIKLKMVYFTENTMNIKHVSEQHHHVL